MAETSTTAGGGTECPASADGPAAGKPRVVPPASGGGLGDPTALQLLRRLDSGPRGLTETQAEERLARFGENTLPARRPVPWAWRFLRSLRDPFTAVLLCLGLVSALVASWGTASVITVLVVVSCVLRSSGEHRADRSITALRELVAGTATVLRRTDADAMPTDRDLPVDQLVPGDVIRLGPGDLVPADVRLLRASGLTVYQAALTGESAAVAKYPVDAPGAGAGQQFEQPQLCFQGSGVASGSGTALVVATGARTRFAASHRDLGRRAASAFDRSVHGISWILVRFTLLTPPLVLMAGAALRGRGLETLPFAVAVAVGMTPEMLPVITTTCLARGASLLARRHGVIVKRLPALHDLGAVDVLCVDKTGTLTQDRPVVDRALDANGKDAPEVLRRAAAAAWWTLQLADLPAPDALDEALLDAADEDDLLAYDGVAALPFDPVRRLATAVVRTPGALGSHTLLVKGAVEAVLERCALQPRERARLLARAHESAADGLRVLAVATAVRPARHRDYTPADERGLTFEGFVTLRDALVPSAADALRVLADRGVAVRVLTGDHPGTAARACRDLGLDPGEVRTAADLDGLTDTQLGELADRTTVFARLTPEHKARITLALRSRGHVTGHLGDGINDLPALHAADVGICPRDATDLARESADVVLADKDLTAISHAITAGRYSSANIAAYLRVTLSSNLGNVIAMLAAGILLPFLPMLPTQVLVQNMCFDAAQLAFAHDRPAPGALKRPTVLRSRDLLGFITGFGLLNAVADLATFGVLALAVHGPGAANDESVFHSGWFTENLLTQALVMLLLRIGRRGAEGRREPGPVGWGAAALTAVGLALPLSPLGPPLGMTALPAFYYPLLAAVLGLYAAGLVVTRSRYERRRAEDEAEDDRGYGFEHEFTHSDRGRRGERNHDGG
ncbi:magnesium-translocating P-type ATPase [Streptomyces sp. NBC_01450]|uniref:magnesium-translocating P-type ATPase n=1 Tax=Streptomyces sp. NBC_01450 TaxID=2903871 RepID=UPI002E351827|nr:magnesium-translocating P-type ATPase [Streptomyces sp. NBC_01450]